MAIWSASGCEGRSFVTNVVGARSCSSDGAGSAAGAGVAVTGGTGEASAGELIASRDKNDDEPSAIGRRCGEFAAVPDECSLSGEGGRIGLDLPLPSSRGVR